MSEDSALSDSFRITESFDETDKRKRKRTIINSGNFVSPSVSM